MTSRITARKDGKFLWEMNGTGDTANCWLFDPNGNAFLCYADGNHLVLSRIYQRENESWKFVSINPSVVGWQPVESQATAALLDEMEEAVFRAVTRHGPS
jgi:hypothetical protein